MIEDLRGDNLERELTDEVTLVDFFATWCGPCKMLGMELDGMRGIKILKVNVDEHQELARSHGVMSVPTVEIYKNKQKVGSFIGFKSKDEIQEMLNRI